ncbi:MAG: hypothetical protein ACKOVA_14455 [Novosphingobium sp.]
MSIKALLLGTSAVLLSTMAMPAMADRPPAPANMLDAKANAAADAAADRLDIERFAREAALMKDLGSAQMNVTKNLPIARFELDRDDPYPAWFAHHIALFKVFPPAILQPYMDMDHARRQQRLIAARCQAIAANGMSAVWTANEPSVLPEDFYAAYPEYRGARIDHMLRARKIYFAPNVDYPDVQAMYRESVTQLLKLCPSIDTFIWVTTDAGSGFAWNPGLYPGANGNSDGAERPLADRVSGFMINIQQAAAAAGKQVRININQIEPRRWMIPTFGPDVEENIVRKLPAGLAVNGKEGPDGKAFDTSIARPAASPFYPIVGLVVPGFAPVKANTGPRRAYELGQPDTVQFNYRLFKATAGQPMGDRLQRLAALRAFAASEVGEDQASNLIEAWQSLDRVALLMQPLDFGGMLRFGHVLNRWVARPMVPYPQELKDEEVAAWKPYLFQARGEEQASNLADIQAMRMYEGWGARLLFQQTIETALPEAEKAHKLMAGIAATQTDPEARAYWDLTAKRVQALIYLLRSANNMVMYQAQLDRVNGIAAKPEGNPVLGVQADWARQDMVNLARAEIDNTVALEKLLGGTSGPLLDLAAAPADEYTMRLGPNLRAAMRQKVRTMNAHWRDYDRMFTIPNP